LKQKLWKEFPSTKEWKNYEIINTNIIYYREAQGFAATPLFLIFKITKRREALIRERQLKSFRGREFIKEFIPI
jgi:hypothetical protein